MGIFLRSNIPSASEFHVMVATTDFRQRPLNLTTQRHGYWRKGIDANWEESGLEA